jgi:hypothetical protein
LPRPGSPTTRIWGSPLTEIRFWKRSEIKQIMKAFCRFAMAMTMEIYTNAYCTLCTSLQLQLQHVHTSEHILQRQQTWLEGSDVTTKMWRTEENLRGRQPSSSQTPDWASNVKPPLVDCPFTRTRDSRPGWREVMRPPRCGEPRRILEG